MKDKSVGLIPPKPLTKDRATILNKTIGMIYAAPRMRPFLAARYIRRKKYLAAVLARSTAFWGRDGRVRSN